MTRNWQNPDRAPSQAELAAWADGELDPAEAGRVEEYLADHPEVVAETEAASRLVRLFRDHAPADPSADAWNAAFDRIDSALSTPVVPRRPRHWPGLLLVVLTAAAMLAGVLLAARFMPARTRERPEETRVELPEGDNNDAPFVVAEIHEVNIISMDADDADRVLMGQPLLGTFDVATPEDIDVVGVEPNWEEGNKPHLKRGERVPMVVVARADQ